mmetsp:Transcript_1852/g.4161  ORF Transcript_1852/g.4161 Transcript_1852/m.4161 type:complete len:91 (+) Transcript_1852:675-947(+)
MLDGREFEVEEAVWKTLYENPEAADGRGGGDHESRTQVVGPQRTDDLVICTGGSTGAQGEGEDKKGFQDTPPVELVTTDFSATADVAVPQ